MEVFITMWRRVFFNRFKFSIDFTKLNGRLLGFDNQLR